MEAPLKERGGNQGNSLKLKENAPKNGGNREETSQNRMVLGGGKKGNPPENLNAHKEGSLKNR